MPADSDQTGFAPDDVNIVNRVPPGAEPSPGAPGMRVDASTRGDPVSNEVGAQAGAAVPKDQHAAAELLSHAGKPFGSGPSCEGGNGYTPVGAVGETFNANLADVWDGLIRIPKLRAGPPSNCTSGL